MGFARVRIDGLERTGWKGNLGVGNRGKGWRDQEGGTERSREVDKDKRERRWENEERDKLTRTWASS